LLNVEKKEINSIDDIFNDDLLGIFDDGEAQSLFEFKYTPREIARAEADFVARRKPCKNFKDYEELFKSVQADLSSGKRKLVKFHESQLNQGNFFVHNGVVLFLEKVIDLEVDKFGKPDGRTKIIFENGTESSMKLRSLGKNLFLNGKGITQSSDNEVEEFIEIFSSITDEDNEAGYIYVLSSKSTDPKIKDIKNLFKIGYSTTPVESRIKNAEKEPTYLMAPVHIEAEYKTFNMNTQKFEQLLHNFFGASCLNIDIWDEKLRRKMPQEWFVVPLNIIDQAIEMIITEEIIHFKYDRDLEVIILKDLK
ncbi:MAG: GIY-YIG nuclease family protein, partial [Sphingobacteriia bacterium]|nr:GIY-YIG nuclease family protein [Sphingobacteriia bacterium]